MVEHDFSASLQKSKEMQRWFFPFYKTVWPDCNIEIVTNIEEQKQGVDVRVHLPRSIIPIEEKLRPFNNNYVCGGDLCIETLSSVEQASPGWIVKDQVSKILAYGWEELDVALLMRYGELKSLYRGSSELWIKKYRQINAQNSGYITRSIAVPLGAVLPYIGHKWVRR